MVMRLQPALSLLSLVSLSSLLVPAMAQPGTRAFLRRPSINADSVVFVCEGDLWLGSISAKTAYRITATPTVETEPKFSPDGKLIAFRAGLDGGSEVYVMPSVGGTPKRLTFDVQVSVQGWSPDGSEVIYRSRRGHPFDNRIYAVKATGGSPRQLQVPYADHGALSPDASKLAYVPVSAEWQNWWHYEGGQADDIWLADLAKKSFVRLTDFVGVDTTPVWVGQDIYFVSERAGLGNLFRLDPVNKRVTPVTTFTDFTVRYPSTDGKRIVLEHGDGIALVDPAAKTAVDLSFTLTGAHLYSRSRRTPLAQAGRPTAIGPAGKRVLWEARGQIFSVPTEQGDVRAIDSTLGARAQRAAWSPDGKRIAFVSDRSGEEQIWIAPTGGEAVQLKIDHRGPLFTPRWSPDGKWIAVGDRESRIMLVEVSSGKLVVADQSDRIGSYDTPIDSYQFSPDSKWLAFTHIESNWLETVWLYEIATGARHQVSSGMMQSASPIFDPSGKYLAFLSNRRLDPQVNGVNNFYGFDRVTKVVLAMLSADTPSPFAPTFDEEGEPKPAEPAKPDAVRTPMRVSVEGLQARVIEAPMPAGRYSLLRAVDGKLMWIAEEEQPSGERVKRLHAYDLKKKTDTVVTSGLDSYEVSSDLKKLLIVTGLEATVADASGTALAPGAAKVSTQGYTLEVQPAAEWNQMFNESWRLARDFFYDPGLHGVDWEAVRKKYAAEMDKVGYSGDIADVLAAMIGELNAGHAYVQVGDNRANAAPSSRIGRLGADLEPVPGQNAYRIAKLYPGSEFDTATRSPLLEPGMNVKVGQYLVAIGGKPVAPSLDPNEMLVGTAGRTITLAINDKPSLDGARTIKVLPLASDGSARYADWVATRRDYVEKASGGAIGYMHVPNMSEDGLKAFTQQYFPNLARSAMIYDVRGNGGGFISGMMLAQMASKSVSWSKPRFGASWSRQSWAFNGHAAALCDEKSGSDAEWFSDMFQRLKLGPVFGKRTWGGLVGSGGGYPLLDGGSLFIPNYGAWMDGKWVVEGPGFKPNEEIEQDPAAVLAGGDPQLDRAIAYLKAKLAKEPITKPQPPPFPVKVRRKT